MQLGLAGRVALVTASSRGLGLAAATSLAREGANLVVTARGAEALAEAEASLAALGVEVLAVRADLAEEPVPGALVEAAVERFGRLDVVVANNGGPPPGGALEVDDAALLGAFQSSFLVSTRLVRAALDVMVPARWGRICCVASTTALEPGPDLALSSVARAGLRSWTKLAAAGLAGSGVTLNLVCPGSHRTARLLALGRDGVLAGEPQDFGDVVAFLCSAQAAFVNGAAVVVDGGATVTT